MRKSVRVKGVVILVLFLITLGIWYAVWREDRGNALTVSFLNVGQGEAIYIEAPSGRQVLVNAGPDASVLRELGKVMPPWDRSLDIVTATDADVGDVSGFVDVLQRYTIDTIIQTGVENSTAAWNLFEKEAADDAAKGTKILTAKRGQIITLGKGAYLEILFPDRNLLAAGTGEGCVVMKLVYGATSFLLPCDSTTGVQNYLAVLDGTKLHADVLLAGAKQNLSPIFTGYVAPAYLVVEGCAAATSTPQIINVCSGAVTFVSDGKTVVRR